jgi:hypothetical protein
MITAKKAQEKHGKSTGNTKNAGLITMAHQFNNDSGMTLPKKGPSTVEENAHGEKGDPEEDINEGPQGRISPFNISKTDQYFCPQVNTIASTVTLQVWFES